MASESVRKKIAKVLVWFSLAILIFLIVMLIVSLITANGNLAMAMIISLILVSILIYVGIIAYKKRYKE